jgi:hypothetical protein
MLNRISRQIILALFWFASAYLALNALLPQAWAWRGAWLNLLIGMVGLLLITGSREGDLVFYYNPLKNVRGLVRVVLLWTVPPVGFTLALVWWSMWLIGFFD